MCVPPCALGASVPLAFDATVAAMAARLNTADDKGELAALAGPWRKEGNTRNVETLLAYILDGHNIGLIAQKLDDPTFSFEDLATLSKKLVKKLGGK